MTKNTKCENCGASLENMNRKQQFCPYCGTKVNIQMSEHDNELEMAEFNEKVRQQQVREKEESEKRDNRQRMIVLIVAIAVLLFMAFYGYKIH